MRYTVYYRRADGEGTKTYLAGLTAESAEKVKRKVFDADVRRTMVWVLDEDYEMLGDPLVR